MNQIKKIVNRNLIDSIVAKQEFSKQEGQIYLFVESVKTIVQCYKEGGPQYISGTGL